MRERAERRKDSSPPLRGGSSGCSAREPGEPSGVSRRVRLRPLTRRLTPLGSPETRLFLTLSANRSLSRCLMFMKSFQPQLELLEDRRLLSVGVLGPTFGQNVTRLQVDGALLPATFGASAAYREYLINQAVQQYSGLFGQDYLEYPHFYVPFVGTNVTLAAGSAVTFDDASSTSSPGFSTTNTQVAGVDEGDTVKTDGHYLYLLSNGQLVILNAWPATNLAIVSQTALSGTPQVEYLDGSRLTVISQDYLAHEQPGAWYWDYWTRPVVDVTVYDVSNPTAPTVVRQTALDGYYNNSRAIGDTVYVALNNYLTSLPAPLYTIQGDTIVYETEAQYSARMETLPLDSLLPHYTTTWTDVNGTQATTGLLSAPEDIYQPAVPGDNNLLSLVSFDVASDNPGPARTVSLITNSEAILYAAPDHFYLIANRWDFAADWTFIDQLSLQGGDITLTATGQVPGTILNQFSVGEEGAYFDIATTTGWEHGTSNNVFVLEAGRFQSGRGRQHRERGLRRIDLRRPVHGRPSLRFHV